MAGANVNIFFAIFKIIFLNILAFLFFFSFSFFLQRSTGLNNVQRLAKGDNWRGLPSLASGEVELRPKLGRLDPRQILRRVIFISCYLVIGYHRGPVTIRGRRKKKKIQNIKIIKKLQILFKLALVMPRRMTVVHVDT